jgi:hypothetical protein
MPLEQGGQHADPAIADLDHHRFVAHQAHAMSTFPVSADLKE